MADPSLPLTAQLFQRSTTEYLVVGGQAIICTNRFGEMIKLKRVYDPPSASDGQRILVERLWPRGVSKEKANVQMWLKAVAPSAELRKWYKHDLSKWEEFQQRYRGELAKNEDMIEEIEEMAAKGPVTFVYAARDENHNSALVLKKYLESRKRQKR
jgi:uncharacterized protein YeaO (DUF488 family)